MTFKYDGHIFDLSPSTISFLHHWNFGTSTQYYRAKDKHLILPDIHGTLIKITNINLALDTALMEYNKQMSHKFKESSHES